MRQVSILLLVLTLTACAGDPADSPEATTVGLDANQTSPPVAGSAGPGGEVGMLSSRGAQTGAPSSPTAAGGNEVAGAGLLFSLPDGWQREAPSSSMRMAQAAIPGSAGSGVLTVFFFGPGGGGGVEANLDRWIGQIEGGSSTRDSFEANGLHVTWVDADGTLLPSQMGMGPTEAQPDARLLGAVIEGPGGPWFFKATGPDSTLAGEREAFLTMLRGARLAR